MKLVRVGVSPLTCPQSGRRAEVFRIRTHSTLFNNSRQKKILGIFLLIQHTVPSIINQLELSSQLLKLMKCDQREINRNLLCKVLKLHSSAGLGRKDKQTDYQETRKMTRF
jgi:hypothetical protein